MPVLAVIVGAWRHGFLRRPSSFQQRPEEMARRSSAFAVSPDSFQANTPPRPCDFAYRARMVEEFKWSHALYGEDVNCAYHGSPGSQ